jgi:hypothetical protein
MWRTRRTDQGGQGDYLKGVLGGGAAPITAHPDFRLGSDAMRPTRG